LQWASRYLPQLWARSRPVGALRAARFPAMLKVPALPRVWMARLTQQSPSTPSTRPSWSIPRRYPQYPPMRTVPPDRSPGASHRHVQPSGPFSLQSRAGSPRCCRARAAVPQAESVEEGATARRAMRVERRHCAPHQPPGRASLSAHYRRRSREPDYRPYHLAGPIA
jgi:hypothetical protein